MTVSTVPAVTSRERKALIGVGCGLGEGEGVGLSLAAAVGLALGAGDGPSAVRSNQMGTTTRTRSKRMKSGNDTRAGLVTPEATESTRPKLGPGTASGHRARPACAASGP